MNVKKVRLICFSPTHTTRKVLEGIAEGIPDAEVEWLDLTLPGGGSRTRGRGADLAVVGVPVYGGRVPLEAARRLGRVSAAGTPAIIVVLYGNREFDDALLELKDITRETGFKPIAAGAFVGEHSFASDATPIANHRPDEKDLKTARAFGKTVFEKLRVAVSASDLPEVEVPGHFPYQERKGRPGASPETDVERCTTCGTCATVCPVGAIVVGETVATDAGACILCCACVKACPEGARVKADKQLAMKAEWLSKNCARRKAPVLFGT